jgi:hypothetical protein
MSEVTPSSDAPQGAEPASEQRVATTSRPDSGTHSTRPEKLDVEKHLLIGAYTKLVILRPKAPSWDQVVAPLFTGVAFLVTLIPADFKNYAGVPSSTWEALVMIITFVSLVVFIVLFARLVWCLWKHPAVTGEQFFEEIIRQMREDDERVEAIQRRVQGESSRNGR